MSSTSWAWKCVVDVHHDADEPAASARERAGRPIGSVAEASGPSQHLRSGDTYTCLAAGFDIATGTTGWFVREAIDLLATRADDVRAAAARAARLADAIIDGAMAPIDRI